MLNVELACLQQMPIFAGVDLAKLKLVAMMGNRLSFQRGEALITSGGLADAVYIVLDGEVDIVREGADATVPLGRRGTGYIVGDIAVLLAETYPVTVMAVGDVTVLRLEANTFLELVQEVPQLALALLRDLGRRVVRMAKLYSDALD